MAEESIFLEHVGDNPRMRLLQYLIEGRDFDYTLTDLLNAGVSWGTLNTLVPKLLELGIVVKTRKIGRATLYKINLKNVAVRQLTELYNHLLLEKLNQMKTKTRKAEAMHRTPAPTGIPFPAARPSFFSSPA